MAQRKSKSKVTRKPAKPAGRPVDAPRTGADRDVARIPTASEIRKAHAYSRAAFVLYLRSCGVQGTIFDDVELDQANAAIQSLCGRVSARINAEGQNGSDNIV